MLQKNCMILLSFIIIKMMTKIFKFFLRSKNYNDPLGAAEGTHTKGKETKNTCLVETFFLVPTMLVAVTVTRLPQIFIIGSNHV